MDEGEEEVEALGLEIPQPATTPRELGRGAGGSSWGKERGQRSTSRQISKIFTSLF